MLGLNIYSKKANCDSLFSEIAVRLLAARDINPTNISCIDMRYQASNRAYQLEAEIELSRVLAISESQNYIDGFKLFVETKTKGGII